METWRETARERRYVTGRKREGRLKEIKYLQAMIYGFSSIRNPSAFSFLQHVFFLTFYLKRELKNSIVSVQATDRPPSVHFDHLMLILFSFFIVCDILIFGMEQVGPVFLYRIVLIPFHTSPNYSTFFLIQSLSPFIGIISIFNYKQLPF